MGMSSKSVPNLLTVAERVDSEPHVDIAVAETSIMTASCKAFLCSARPDQRLSVGGRRTRALLYMPKLCIGLI